MNYPQAICIRCQTPYPKRRKDQKYCGPKSNKNSCSYIVNKSYTEERAKQLQAYRQKNKKLIAKKYKEWLRNNPEKYQARILRRKLSLLNNEGIHTVSEWNYLKKLYKYRCAMCFKPEPEIKLTEDHKIPLALGGSNWIDNIQPLCRSCNSRKNKRIWFASCPLSKEEYLRLTKLTKTVVMTWEDEDY